MSKPVFARSMAFNAYNEPFVLVRQGTENYIIKITDDHKLVKIRKVPSGFWWFKIYNDGAGQEISLLREDNRTDVVKLFSLHTEEKGKKLATNDVYSWHLMTSSSNKRSYSLINRQVHYFDGKDYISLDENPELRLAEEENDDFFVANEKGIFRRKLSDKDGEWTHFYKENLSSCKQLIYDDKNKNIIVITGSQKGFGWVHFVDIEGNAKKYKRASGFWSANYFDGRSFFFVWDSIIEMASDGKIINHDICGDVSRNQCLFSSERALYFVCEHEIYMFKDEKWTNISLGNITFQ